MTCSRVAFSLPLAVLAAAVIALGPADGRVGVAADLGLEQSTHTDTLEGAAHCQDAADWRQHDSTGGEQPSPRIPPLWDGHAAGRIVEVLAQKL